MSPTPAASPGFHRLALFTLCAGATLIWVGASVTTTGSGMAFADWPLSHGSVNPEGWLDLTPLLLEHAHRLLAAAVGLLALAMFVWQWRLARPGSGLLLVLVGAFLLLFTTVHTADGLSKGSEDALARFARLLGAGSLSLWIVAVMTLIAVLVWLVRGLREPGWPVALKLAAAALVTVVMQAVLGGLCVLAVSDPFGIAHACLGQLSFCLFIAIAIVTSQSWPRVSFVVPERKHRRLVTLSSMLLIATFLQLVFGAIVRHTQRAGLAATDVFTTGGRIVPPFVPVDVFSIFLHKAWGLLVFGLAAAVAGATQKPWRGQHRVTILARLLILLSLVQITLGAFVIVSGKNFWVTNLHVVNGLAIPTTAFIAAVVAWRGQSKSHEGRTPDSADPS